MNDIERARWEGRVDEATEEAKRRLDVINGDVASIKKFTGETRERVADLTAQLKIIVYLVSAIAVGVCMNVVLNVFSVH